MVQLGGSSTFEMRKMVLLGSRARWGIGKSVCEFKAGDPEISFWVGKFEMGVEKLSGDRR